MKKIAFAALLAVAALFTSCASSNTAPQGNVSRERYFLGTYSAVFSSSIITLDKAVRATCAQARLREIRKNNTANSCEYFYKDVNNIPLRITIVEQKNNTVKITLKVGGVTGWDKEACQLLLVNIDNRLRSLGSMD